MSDDLETRLNILTIRFHDEVKLREELQTRLEGLEYFIRSKYPGDIGPEAGTKADPDLEPVVLDFQSQAAVDPAKCSHPSWRNVEIGGEHFMRCTACGADKSNVEAANAKRKIG